MLQVFFLVIEAKKVEVAGHTHIVDSDTEPNSTPGAETSNLLSYRPLRVRHAANTHTNGTLLTPLANGPANENTNGDANGDANGNVGVNATHAPYRIAQNGGAPCRRCSKPGHCQAPQEKQLRWFKDPAVYSAAIAALLFIATLILQFIGLAKAAQALGASSSPPNVRWCSPLFQPFGVAAGMSFNEIDCVLFPQ